MVKSPNPIRLSAFYAAYFAIVGITMPYWPLWLESRGLDALTIASLLAVGSWLKLGVNPLVAAHADRRGSLARTAGFMALLAGIGYAGFYLADPIWSYFLIAALTGAAFASILPLGDALILSATKGTTTSYGRVRVWGSVTFILATFALGVAIDEIGSSVILPSILLGFAFLTLSCRLLPEQNSPATSRWTFKTFLELVSDKRFLLFVLASGLVQSTHAVFYAFSSISWTGLGFSETEVGVLWTLGVVAEIVLFWMAGKLGRIGAPLSMMAIGAVSAMVRWPLMAVADTVTLNVPLQLLHAFTFGAAHLGAMRYLQENAPKGLEASAQAVYAALVSGVVMGLSLPLAGVLYQNFGMAAYHFMAIPGLLALIPLYWLSRLGPLPRRGDSA